MLVQKGKKAADKVKQHVEEIRELSPEERKVRRKRHWIHVAHIIVAVVIAFVVLVISVDRLTPYMPHEAAEEAMLDGNGVYVRYLDKSGEDMIDQALIPTLGVYFDGPGTDRLMIFYPGAEVDVRSYAVLYRALAETGTDVIAVRMPVKLAVLDLDRADIVLEHLDRITEGTDNDYQQLFLGGHSMGASLAGIYVSDNLDIYDGVIMLAGFPTRHLQREGFSMLSVYGTRDIDVPGLQRNAFLRPDDYTEVVIEGGNHAQFGDYGVQLGDGDAWITKEDQWAQTIEAMNAYLDAHPKK